VAFEATAIVITGIGIDVVEISRFKESIERTPAMKEKIFTKQEAQLSLPSLAARFAAKEALVKALDARNIFHWHDAEVINEESGKPRFIFSGTLATRLDGFRVHLTISHDAGIASAMVIIEEN
jgi:holo-[acyl-carrier protein] synthase